MPIYGKIVDGELVRYVFPFRACGLVIVSNDPIVLRAYGIKPVISADPPDVPANGRVVPVYTDQPEHIAQSWVLEDGDAS